ncbi:hypothetical protein RZN25_01975 [Bacillaceae bacterium S4-13-56]
MFLERDHEYGTVDVLTLSVPLGEKPEKPIEPETLVFRSVQSCT